MKLPMMWNYKLRNHKSLCYNILYSHFCVAERDAPTLRIRPERETEMTRCFDMCSSCWLCRRRWAARRRCCCWRCRWAASRPRSRRPCSCSPPAPRPNCACDTCSTTPARRSTLTLTMSTSRECKLLWSWFWTVRKYCRVIIQDFLKCIYLVIDFYSIKIICIR